jgi:hypothetical protein
MSVSTNGQLSFGIAFEEGFEFPWDDERFDGEIDKWWRCVRGFTHTTEYPFNEFGDYKPGINSKSPIVDAYYREVHDWEKANPIPIEVVNYCSDSCPMYILASEHSFCRRGYTANIDLTLLMQDEEEARQRLLSFLEEFGIETDQEPAWLLTGFWGD